ncbi:MAG: RnfABCDGE type electron transport complex subunit G [Deltaproteobacteria bacterium]|nr:RnfABCDGE type electron transport complex subunit G [Deltaproteobacteria bacterium]
MGRQLRMVVVLTLVSVVAAALLSYVAELTTPLIREHALRELRQGISDVLPGLQDYEERFKEDGFEIYEGKNEEGNTVGFAIVRTGAGFSDTIKLIFGVSADFSKIYSLKVLEQKETPGLGAKIVRELPFLQFWRGVSIAEPIRYAKPPRPKEQLEENEINAITGATISSEAVVAAVNNAVEDAKKIIGETHE